MENIQPYKNRVIVKHEKVAVHRNLKTGGLSIKADGIVCGHTEAVYLRNVKFKVGQAGNKRVRLERQKNVHAHVCGEIVLAQTVIDFDSRCKFLEKSGYERVTYNPYLFSQFVTYESHEPVMEAREAYLLKGRVYIKR